ncbi:bifunctional DNA primase/polymerase [Mycobacterium sp. M1]|uniref:Bifunctional DNA primase/polymerase n=1 Tax=Mycolicibacter acidiphilus TaxID=2835306 RepID=A0ABS5REA8_9MYCO|nr:bifunctional DNA primase/polymerase [Mycolicibacter acidiphilus]MBS9532612.1 bifunctional DNA primase/polymerase [Mycolicibacter acidiphilus]
MIGGTNAWDILGARPAGDLSDLKPYVREVTRRGIPLLILEPGGTEPIDLRTPAMIKEDGGAEYTASSDTSRLERLVTQAGKRFPDDAPNLGTITGDGLLVISTDHTAGADAFQAVHHRVTGQRVSPTVITPGNDGGAYFYFALPDGVALSDGAQRFSAGGGDATWRVVPAGEALPIPPSVTADGPLRWVSGVFDVHPSFLEVLEGRAGIPSATPTTDWNVIGETATEGLSDLKSLAVRLGTAGVPLIFLSPLSKEPVDLRTALMKELDDRAAQEAAKAAGNPRWAAARVRAGLQTATTDTERLAAYADTAAVRYTHGQVPNLATVPGNGLLIIDTDHAEGVAAFCAQYREWTGQDIGPTVATPGVQNPDGSWHHRDGGHFYFTLPAGYTLPDSVRSFAVGSDKLQWSIFPLDHYVLIPPSVRKEGPYRWVGQVIEAPPQLLAMIEGDANKRTEEMARQAERAATRSGPSGIDSWAARTSWAELLEPDGWFMTGCRTSCGCPETTAPGPHGSPKSATAHEVGCLETDTSSGHGPLHVWTDNPPDGVAAYTRATGSRTLTKLQYAAWVRHGGDEAVAIKALGITNGMTLMTSSAELRAAAGLPPTGGIAAPSSGIAAPLGTGAVPDDDRFSAFTAAASAAAATSSSAFGLDDDCDEFSSDDGASSAPLPPEGVDVDTLAVQALMPANRKFEPYDKEVYPAGYHSTPELLEQIFNFSDETREIFHTARSRKPKAVHPVPLLLREMTRRGARCPVGVRLWEGTPLSTYVVIAGRSGLGKSESAKPDASPWRTLKAPTYLENLATRKVTLSAEDAAAYIARQVALGQPVPTVGPVKTPTGASAAPGASSAKGTNGKAAGNSKPSGGITGPSAPVLIPYNFDRTKSLGSGQVLSDNLIDLIGKGEDTVVTMKPHPCVFLEEDEMITMLRAAKNEASTLIGTLNSAWAGAPIGNETRLHGDRRTNGPYSIFLIAGLQPKLADQLLCHDDSGFLQRCVLVPTADPYRHVNAPDIPRPAVKPSGAMPLISGTSTFTADPRVIAEIEGTDLDYDLDHLGDAYAEAMSHAKQVQVRLAHLGALLHGSLHISWELWVWAGWLMEVSRRVFAWMEAQSRAQDRVVAETRGVSRSVEKAAQDTYTSEAIEETCARILEVLGTAGAAGMSAGNISGKLSGKQRPYRNDAIKLLLDRNLIFAKGMRYVLIDFKAA